jgi:hypothetical protein
MKSGRYEQLGGCLWEPGSNIGVITSLAACRCDVVASKNDFEELWLELQIDHWQRYGMIGVLAGVNE